MPTLNWNTRPADIHAAARAPFCAMSAVCKAYGDAAAENFLIQGDNLHALKSLIPHYAGAVKCVYIDPPFNTGADFSEYDDNLEHTQWLEMMFPRLALMRELLAEDGSIWVSIDNREAAHLKIMMDEIFLRKNFVNFITNTTAPSGFKATASNIFAGANYICVYAKNIKSFSMQKQFIERDYDKAYSKFLENPEADYSKWKWRGLRDVFAKHLGYESPQAAINALKKICGADAAKFAFNKAMGNFAIANADRVFRTAALTGGAKDKRIDTIEKSAKERGKVFVHPGEDQGYRILNGERIMFFNQSFAEISGKRVPARAVDDVWTDIGWVGIAGEGGVKFNNGKKPERLVERILKFTTSPGDLVLDSFLGSGTTAAVAHKMERRWIGIEKRKQAETLCAKRMQKVVDGADQSGITKSAKWKGGGGFHFLRLGGPVFSDNGKINSSVKFPALAAHVWFAETRTPLSLRAGEGPFLGVHKGTGYALLYNGILKDKQVNGGNVLIHSVLRDCRAAARERGLPDEGRLVIYGNSCRLRKKALRAANAIFRQTPYELKTR